MFKLVKIIDQRLLLVDDRQELTNKEVSKTFLKTLSGRTAKNGYFVDVMKVATAADRKLIITKNIYNEL